MLNPRIGLAVTLAFVALILVGLYFASRIDLAFSSHLETFSGPRAYPSLVLLVMLLLNLIIAGGQFRDALRRPEPGSEREPFFQKRSIWSTAIFLSLIVFVLEFEKIGYIVTMVPLLTVVALLCGAPSAIRAFVVAVCLAALCLVIFRYGLATVLPEGILGIDSLF